MSVIIDLIRVGFSEYATYGVLRYGGVPCVLTLERPWRNNEREISCIPAGRYRCREIHSMKFGDTYEVCDVPNRTHILFHAGNSPEDTEGCLLVGMEFGGTLDQPRVRSSFVALQKWLTLLDGVPEFDLTIHEVHLGEEPIQL